MIVDNKKLPVTVLSGFLGAGKTTLLKNLLLNRKNLKVALIVNDMSEINIDAKILSAQDIKISRQEEKLVEMSNGCICCTLREDLLAEVRRIAQAKKYDYLLIESTGISEPMPVAETFFFEDESRTSLGDIAQLDTMVTMIDAKNFLAEVETADYLRDRDLQVDKQDQRTISDLLIEQVEFANVLVINKSDLVSSQQLKIIKALLKKLNSSARILTCKFGNVPAEAILYTKLFDYEHASNHDNWMNSPIESKESESEEFGISSFIYKRKSPFHPVRFFELISSQWQGVIRSKGTFWIASRPDLVGVWSQAGGSCRAHFEGKWFASLPKSEWNFETNDDFEEFQKEWDEQFGDRTQEIVLIGKNMDKKNLVKMLDTCLMTDEELSKGYLFWQNLGDQFIDNTVQEI